MSNSCKQRSYLCNKAIANYKLFRRNAFSKNLNLFETAGSQNIKLMSKSITIQQNIQLAPLTTFKIGGKARLFIKAETEEQIIEAINFADENKFEVFILGGGSNVLIADKVFDGLVVQVANKGISAVKAKDKTYLVTAQAGEDWDEFVEYCVGKNLAGIECLSGIPGLIGGTPIQNVGAYGQEVSETITSVRVFDRRSKSILELTNADCGFEYRRSIFNSTQKKRFIVLAVTYALEKNGKPKIIYKDLLNRFENSQPTLLEVRENVCKIRAEKAMLVRQGGLDAQSAGSFFKNPIIERSDFIEIEKHLTKLKKLNKDEQIPSFAIDKNKIKIPAAWLIEKTGFHKGFKLGNAGLSTRHTLALTNRGNATAEEILQLKNGIQKKVFDLFGIKLIPEPDFINF